MAKSLDDVRVLLVEDRAMIAMAMSDRLRDVGATIVGPAATLSAATRIAESTPFDLALLDVDLAGEFSYPLARALRERGVPVVLMTGYAASSIPNDLRDLPLFDNLGSMAELTEIVREAVYTT